MGLAMGASLCVGIPAMAAPGHATMHAQLWQSPYMSTWGRAFNQWLAAGRPAGGAMQYVTDGAADLTPAAGTPANVLVDQDKTKQTHNEPYIAANPTNALNLVAGSNDGSNQSAGYSGYYYTMDGGKTWAGGILNGKSVGFTGGDPTIAYSRKGVVYYGELAGVGGGSALSVFSSADGGKTWSPMLISVPSHGSDFYDRPFLTVDNSGGKNDGTIYMSFADFTSNDTLKIVHSSDGGKTWSKPVAIAPAGSSNGAIPLVGQDGTIYVGYLDFSRSTQDVVISKDGGQTWSKPIVAAHITQAPANIPHTPQVRVASLPSFAISPKTGTLVFTWTDGRNKDVDIYATHSADGGQTWSKAVRVNSDKLNNGADQFMPWVAAAPDGAFAIDYNDRRLDPKDTNYNTFFTYSTDDGATWIMDQRISSVASNPKYAFGFRAPFLGDYIGMAADSNGVFHPVWTDLRRKHDDVYTVAIGKG